MLTSGPLKRARLESIATLEGTGLAEDVPHDVRFFDAGEFGVEAAEGVGELLVVDAEAVEHRGVQVAEVDGVLGDVVAEVVGLAVFDAGLHAGAGEPDGEAAAVMVAAGVGVAERALAEDGAAEFGDEDDERVFEQAALLAGL